MEIFGVFFSGYRRVRLRRLGDWRFWEIGVSGYRFFRWCDRSVLEFRVGRCCFWVIKGVGFGWRFIFWFFGIGIGTIVFFRRFFLDLGFWEDVLRFLFLLYIY